MTCVISMIQHVCVCVCVSVCVCVCVYDGQCAHSDLSSPQGKKKRRKRDNKQDSGTGRFVCFHMH